jgi:hypothetical protein
VDLGGVARPGRRRHMSTLRPVGDWRHFSQMLEAYTLCAMLPKDDPVFTS